MNCWTSLELTVPIKRSRRRPKSPGPPSLPTPAGIAERINIWSSHTMGDAEPWPGSSTFQRTFFVSLHSVGGSAVGDTPVANGPRHWGQPVVWVSDKPVSCPTSGKVNMLSATTVKPTNRTRSPLLIRNHKMRRAQSIINRRNWNISSHNDTEIR